MTGEQMMSIPRGDAIKGIKHFEDEVLEAEVTVASGKDRFIRTPDRGPAVSAHVYNSTQSDYIVRVYRVEKSVRLPKVVK